jgi:DNA-binding beta-propeller fold protein YncE
MKYIPSLLLVITILLILPNSAFAYKTVEFAMEFGGKGEAPGKLSEETRLAFDRNLHIYMVDAENRRVQKFNNKGDFIMEISTGEEFLFIQPMDISVDVDGNIYVVDWNSVHIDGTKEPRIFNYGPCIHKFSSDSSFIDTFTLENLSKKAIKKENAVPAIDPDGKFSLMIVPEKTDRKIYISVDPKGNIYVLDQDTIYKLDSTGEVLMKFPEPGQLRKATDIEVDSSGNIYIADTGSHRVVKYSSDGKLMLSFGREGEADGEFMGEIYVTAALNGTVLVADSAKYEKILRTTVKHRQIISSDIVVTGQEYPLIPGTRDFRTIIRRFQRFDADGKSREKVIYRIDKSDPEQRDMEFKAVDPAGNLYLIDKDTLIIRTYSIQPPVRWSAIDKVFTCRVQHSESRSQLDNFYDLNPYFDFDEREKYTLMSAIMRFNYDMTESFRVSLTSSLLRLNGKTYDKYPGEYADPYGFIQDDETSDDYTAARVRLDLSLVLDHDPFKYRIGDFFVYFGGGRYDFDVIATDPTFQNKRRLDENLWWFVWATGIRYDMGSSLRISLIAAQHRPPGFMNYDYIYWDERGELYATGTGEGASTEVFISVAGAF